MERIVLVALVSLVSIRVSIAWLRQKEVVDVPNHRSSHQVTTVRGAGVGLLPALVIAPFVAGTGFDDESLPIVVGGVVFGLLGLTDDLVSLGARLRLGLQLLIATAVVVLVVRLVDGPGLTNVGVLVFAVVAVAAVLNAVNFMDGINGITTVTAVITLGSYAAHSVDVLSSSTTFVLAAVAVGTLAFLPFNFPSAQAFLGDSGSYLLGGAMGATALMLLRAGVPLLSVAAPLLLYAVDTFSTLVKRVVRGENPWTPHRSHVYQRLTNERELGHVRVTILVGVLTLIAVGIAAWGDAGGAAQTAVAGVLLVCVAALYLASPSLLPKVSRADAV